MKEVALITGASRGIGAELARYHAASGGDLILIARRKSLLNKLKVELEKFYNIKVLVIAIDLSQPKSSQKIYRITKNAGIQVEILINNAGFSSYGKFHENNLLTQQKMIHVNMVSLIELTHLYLQDMVNRNSGKILHVGSTAAFRPSPLQAIYYSSKSFVVSFSLAIAQELSRTNVSSTVLCPSLVATDFAETANLKDILNWSNAATPKSVARCGYDAMMEGKLLVINKAWLRFVINWILPLFPRKILLILSEKVMSPKKDVKN